MRPGWDGGFQTGAARRINVQVGGDIHAALAGLLDMFSDVAHQSTPARLISDFKMEDLDRQSSAFADGDCFVHGIDNLAALAADMARRHARPLFPPLSLLSVFPPRAVSLKRIDPS